MKYLFIVCFGIFTFLANAQQKIQAVGEEKILPVAQEMPTLPGCVQIKDFSERRNCQEDKIEAFLTENLEYPEAARAAGVDGFVLVRFIVDEKGKTSEFAVDEDPGYGMGEAAMKAIKKLGKWEPARNMGKEVKVRMSVPVRFKLPDVEEAPMEVKQDVYTVVDHMPRYQGCESGDETEAKNCTFQSIASYMRSSLVYPETAKKQKITGTVIVKFVVDETGKVTNATVEDGIGGGCDEEALRMVNSMPQWAPGMQNGKAVKVWQRIPFQFAPTENE